VKKALVLSAIAIGLVVILLLVTYETSTQSQVLVNIPVGRSWPRSIVIDPSSDLIYVDALSGFYPPVGYSFEEINGSSGAIINTVPFPGIPGEMTIDQANNVVYALGSNSSSNSNSIFVYSASDGNFDRNISVNASAYNIAFDAPLNRLFVSTEYGLIAFNATSGSTIASISLGNFSEGMAIDQDSETVYVANYLSESISVVSATTLALIKTIQLPNASYPSELALDTSTGMLYTTTDQNYIVAINTHSEEIERTIQISSADSNKTFSIAFDQKNNVLYVATDPGTLISEVDVSSGTVTSTINLSYGAYEMLADQANGNLYITNYHQITSIALDGQGHFVSYALLGAAVVIITVTAVLFVTRRKSSMTGKQTQSSSPT